VGNPHQHLSGVHIAGTKGKGSTAMFTEAILRAHGLKTGLFTSPHFINKEERIQVDGRAFQKEDFIYWMNHIRPTLLELQDTALPPTFFDIITTVSLLHFHSKEVAAAILEVGLGGRLDSTNVFLPEVSVITRLGFDHVEKLGNTLGQIAAEKAGIIKPGIPVIAQPQERSARLVLEKKCLETGSILTQIGEEIGIEEDSGESAAAITIHTPNRSYRQLHLSVLGRHQRLNAATALSAAEIFLKKKTGQLPDPGRVQEALAGIQLPGRIQVLATNPLVVADGAHNPVAMEVVIQTVRQELQFQNLHILFACSSDKDMPAMVAQLAPIARRWTFTSFDFPRIEDPANIQALLHEIDPKAETTIAPTPLAAIQDAYQRSNAADCILCCGSFYLIGEIFKLIGCRE